MKKIACIGAGFSGAVIARILADAGYHVDVFDSRDHVAGNCHTYRDSNTGVMVHAYGPHIFHTDNEEVWRYVNRFAKFEPFVNRVKAVTGGQVYSMPINLHTINQYFGKTLSPKEASEFIANKARRFDREPISFEEQALAFVGDEIYNAFFKNYTQKQWGVSPTELPASILKRLPLRFNYNDNYYSSKYQGIPMEGYTSVVENILNHEKISVNLSVTFSAGRAKEYFHVFNSGPLDAWFEYKLGRLGYRTLKFESEVYDGDYQGNAVINYCDMSAPWTRISEHKHFAPWESHERTLIYKEYSALCGDADIPYYPIRLINDKAMLRDYFELANKQEGVTFVGRLGTYRYLDMHVTIAEAFDVARRFLSCTASGNKMPAFNVAVV